MTLNQPISYFSPDESPTRKPPALVVVASIGIVLGVVLIIAQSVSGVQSAIQDRGLQPPALKGTDWSGAGFAIGILLRTVVTLTMIVACGGLLGLRRSAREVAIMTAYAWIVVAALEVFISIYAYIFLSGAKTTLVATLLVSIAYSVLIGILFPIALLVILRWKRVADLFAQQPRSSRLHSAVSRPLAIVILIYAAICVIEGGIGLIAREMSSGSMSLPTRILYFRGLPESAMSSIDMLLYFALFGAMIVGCILVLSGRDFGAWILIICAIAKMAFLIASWNTSNDAARYLYQGAPSFGSRSTKREFWFQIHSLGNLVSMRVTSLLWPALVVAAFTRQANKSVEVIA